MTCCCGSSMAATNARPQAWRCQVIALAQLAYNPRLCCPSSRHGCSVLKAGCANCLYHSLMRLFALSQLLSPPVPISSLLPVAQLPGPSTSGQLLCPQSECDCKVPRQPAAWAAASEQGAQTHLAYDPHSSPVLGLHAQWVRHPVLASGPASRQLSCAQAWPPLWGTALMHSLSQSATVWQGCFTDHKRHVQCQKLCLQLLNLQCNH